VEANMAGKRLAATQPLGKNLIATGRVNLKLEFSTQGFSKWIKKELQKFQRNQKELRQSQEWVKEQEYGMYNANLHSGNYVNVHNTWPGSAAYNSWNFYAL